jgi:hypothetical protein
MKTQYVDDKELAINTSHTINHTISRSRLYETKQIKDVYDHQYAELLRTHAIYILSKQHEVFIYLRYMLFDIITTLKRYFYRLLIGDKIWNVLMSIDSIDSINIYIKEMAPIELEHKNLTFTINIFQLVDIIVNKKHNIISDIRYDFIHNDMIYIFIGNSLKSILRNYVLHENDITVQELIVAYQEREILFRNIGIQNLPVIFH